MHKKEIMKVNARTIAILSFPLVVIALGFYAYYSGLYDELGVTDLPVMGLAMLSLSVVIVYQQFMIRRLRAEAAAGQ